MTSENGSLIYISPEGYTFEDAYKTVNGTEMGNVTQDMAFHDGKIYVISQNGEKNTKEKEFKNDGVLIVMNAKTLKKELAYPKTAFPALDWPTHIAVIDNQHIYVRDNKGIHRIDLSNPEKPSITDIADSKGAIKTKFAVLNGKVYAIKNYDMQASILEISPTEDKVKSIVILS